MDKISNWMEEKVLPIANKISQQKFLKAISNGVLSVMPFMVVGCFAMILWCPPLKSANMDPGFWQSFMMGWEWIADTFNFLWTVICTCCLDFMCLYVVPSIAYNLAKEEKMDGFLPAGLAVVTFGICAGFDAEGGFTTGYFGGAGLFTGIVVAILTVELLKFLIDKNFGKIEIMGESVPPAITQSFISLFPAAVVICAAALLAWLPVLAFNTPLSGIIALVLSPLVNVLNNPFGIAILSMLTCVLWWFGIHDSVITDPISPLLTTMFLANADAVKAGAAATALPYIVSKPFYWIFITVGGSGGTLGLCILLLLFAKSKQCKTVGKLGIVPACFNINEPVIFGLPIMLNPVLLIPFVLAHGVNAGIAYTAMALKLCNTAYLYPSWNLPAPIGALLSTMDVKAVVVMFIIIAADMLLYYPFMKMYDKKMLEEEQAD